MSPSHVPAGQRPCFEVSRMEEARWAGRVPSWGAVLGRAVAGGAIMALALGSGVALGAPLADAVNASGRGAQLVAAIPVSVVAAVLVLMTLRRSRRTWTSIGFGETAASVRALLTGLGITAASAALVLGAGTAVGLLSWTRPDLSDLAAFVAVNRLVALLLEALPEETTLRGLTWTSLREHRPAVVAALGTTLVFMLVPGAASMVAAAIRRLTGGEPLPVGLAPPGQHTADYLILLFLFGLTLVAARTALREAPLWTAIGTHLAFLTVNRITLEGADRNAGWSAEQSSPDAVLLIPLYLLVAAAAFVVRGRLVRGRPGPVSAATAIPESVGR
ncbi:type II CAAX prenyl endopeptidase Rce1 family protein [Streptomyces sp. NPDC057137]|uniref:CPBP family glutamic-type intramembrane protease n=1 Tax=Streptomyces sp. NPDC057137 TaxID=3346030 RepID=UPI003628AE11